MQLQPTRDYIFILGDRIDIIHHTLTGVELHKPVIPCPLIYLRVTIYSRGKKYGGLKPYHLWIPKLEIPRFHRPGVGTLHAPPRTRLTLPAAQSAMQALCIAYHRFATPGIGKNYYPRWISPTTIQRSRNPRESILSQLSSTLCVPWGMKRSVILMWKVIFSISYGFRKQRGCDCRCTTSSTEACQST